MQFTISKWDVSVVLSARKSWNSFNVYKGESTWHLVWGKFSLHIEDWSKECYYVCKQCDSIEVDGIGNEDEYLTYCESCCSVEGGYKYMNKREFERLFE